MDDKVYKPTEIADQPLPQETNAPFGESSGTKDIVTPNETQDQPLPRKVIAQETISSRLNTLSGKILGAFEFVQHGAIQIGKFVTGVSGDIRITPNGITARDLSGNTTFALNGEDGSAVFSGEIRSGSLVSGQVAVGNNRIIIDGDNQTIIINDGTNDRILIGLDVGGF